MREEILQVLRQEGHISGEQLGKRFHISRTAVWKHVNELRKRGYEIHSSTKSGYQFVRSTTLLLPEEIKAGLHTITIGRHILYYDTVSSTQDTAEELARNGAEDGTVIVAETQTSGRGRKGRKWISLPQGSGYLSIILRPNLMPSQVFQIPLLAGVAVSKAIKRVTDLQPQIKWPNDVLINGKKVAGILTEMSSELDRVNYIILGIGINVNTPGTLITESTAGMGTSLTSESHKTISRVQLVQCLLQEFEAIYVKYLGVGFSPARKEWKTLSNTLNSQVKVSDGGEEIEGLALDIDENGFLLVRNRRGEIRKIISGDVSFSKNTAA